MALQAHSQFVAAAGAYPRAVRLSPDNPDYPYSLGVVLANSGNLLRRTMAANPSLRLAHLHLGRIYAIQKRYPQTIAEFGGMLPPADNDTPGFLYAPGDTQAQATDPTKTLQVLVDARDMGARQGQNDLAQTLVNDPGTAQHASSAGRSDFYGFQ